MSEDKQTFVDPKSGDEIKSTWLARWVAGMVFASALLPIMGLGSGLLLGLLGIVGIGPPGGGIWGWGLVGLLGGLVLGPFIGLFYGLRSTFHEAKKIRSDRISRWTHDTIVRIQHLRRQRLLRSQDDQDVPDTALSRAQPPGKPQATDAALSIADDPEEADHLTVEVEEEEGTTVDV